MSLNSLLRRRLPAVPLAIILLLGLASTASAHEHREVGEYEVSVGFSNEPALVNQPNGLALSIHHGHGDEGTPVEGLHETLKAEITFGGETKELDLRAAFGQPGSYTADIFPTAEGAYTFRIFGTIDGTAIDESFTSGPETFAEVESTDTIAFPAATSGAEDSTNSAISDAQDTADSARMLAIIAILVGVVGVAAGIAGALAAKNARSADASN